MEVKLADKSTPHSSLQASHNSITKSSCRRSGEKPSANVKFFAECSPDIQVFSLTSKENARKILGWEGGQGVQNIYSLAGLDSNSEGVKSGMGWVVVGPAVFGAPRFALFVKICSIFSGVLAQNRGALKTAVPTTHPILSAAPQQSEICVKFSVFHAVFDVKFW